MQSKGKQMKYFEKYVSNTLAGSSNQSFFITDNKDCEYTGRVFYKIFCGGKFNYSLLFSNMTDSSYRGVNAADEICDSWVILDMGAAVVKAPGNPFDKQPFADVEIEDMQQITFGGSEKRIVKPGEFFTSDEFELDGEKGDFICIEMTFKGTKIPYHDEVQIPIYIYEDGKFVFNNKMPLPQMLGCERNVEKRIAFLGDSITQGIGATFNSYNHWCAKIADSIGEKYSFWNLGIGCAKAMDAAGDGAWLFKAKQCDFVSVCLGVNDINRGRSAQQLKNDLAAVVKLLRKEGIRVGIFTPFPYDYKDEYLEVWLDVCSFIKNDLSKECEYCFVTSDYVGSPEKPQIPRYGGHPNDEGCSVLADGFVDYIGKIGFEF